MKIIYKYSCGIDEAYNRVNNFLEKLTKDYSRIISHPTKEWDDKNQEMNFEFDIGGTNITGNVALYNEGLVLQGDLPFPASLMKRDIEKIIQGNLDEIFK